MRQLAILDKTIVLRKFSKYLLACLMVTQTSTVFLGLLTCVFPFDYRMKGVITIASVSVDILLQIVIAFICFHLGGQSQLRHLGFTMVTTEYSDGRKG